MRSRGIIPALAAGILAAGALALSGWDRSGSPPSTEQAGPAPRVTLLLLTERVDAPTDSLAEPPGQDGFERFAEALDLSDGQKAQVRAILAEGREKAAGLRGDREGLRAFFKEQRVRIDAVLTPGQKARLYKGLRQRKDSTGLRVLAGLAEALDLTDGQRGKICFYYATYNEVVWFFRFILNGADSSAQT
jgi:hypothetical protein